MAGRLRIDDDEVPLFHEDLMTEIMGQLPVKSLCCFKCVCKKWLAETSDPSLITKHLNSSNNKERLLLCMLEPGTKRRIFALFTDETFSDYQDPKLLKEDPKHHEVIKILIGPCNGIFVVVYDDNRGMYLLNPATRQRKLIPQPEFKIHFSIHTDIYGFGTDPSSCYHFKVIMLRHFPSIPVYHELPINLVFDSDDDDDDDPDIYIEIDTDDDSESDIDIDTDEEEEEEAPDYPLQMAIYTSRTNSWSYSKDLALMEAEWYAIQSLCNTCVNGMYYWLTIHRSNNALAGLLAFDMETERFSHDEMIQVPHSARQKKCYLAVCFDCIALLTYDDYNGIDIWLMEEGFWSKKYKVSPTVEGFVMKKPVGVWKRDGLVFLDGERQQIVLYNLVTEELRIPGAKETYIYFSMRNPTAAYAYKESLVPL